MFRQTFALSLALFLPISWALQGCGLQPATNSGQATANPAGGTVPPPGPDAKLTCEKACVAQGDTDNNHNCLCDKKETIETVNEDGTKCTTNCNPKDKNHWYLNPWVLATAAVIGGIEACRSTLLSSVDCNRLDKTNYKLDMQSSLVIPPADTHYSELYVQDSNLIYYGEAQYNLNKIKLYGVNYSNVAAFCVRSTLIAKDYVYGGAAGFATENVQLQAHYAKNILEPDSDDTTSTSDLDAINKFKAKFCLKPTTGTDGGAWLHLKRNDGTYYTSSVPLYAIGWSPTTVPQTALQDTSLVFKGLNVDDPKGTIYFQDPTSNLMSPIMNITQVQPDFSLSTMANCRALPGTTELQCKVNSFLNQQLSSVSPGRLNRAQTN